MAARRERRLADPVCALTAHLGVAEIGAIHPLRHVMAADPGAAMLPSGTRVEVLCGQPEQKYGAQDRAGQPCSASWRRRSSAEAGGDGVVGTSCRMRSASAIAT